MKGRCLGKGFYWIDVVATVLNCSLLSSYSRRRVSRRYCFLRILDSPIKSENDKSGAFARASMILGILLFLLFPLFVQDTFAQSAIEFSTTINPVGSGARATGMGGAFISIADDATAASWNPAGLINLEKPEVSTVYAFFSRKQAYNSAEHPEINTTNNMSSNGINYASAVLPFKLLDRNMVVSFNYQRLYEMSKSVNFKYNWDLGNGILKDNIKFVQQGYLYTISPAFAAQIAPSLYLGATLNLWQSFFGKNGWRFDYASADSGNVGGTMLTEKVNWSESNSFKGTNLQLGALWNFYGPLTAGLVYKSAFDGKMRHETDYLYSQQWEGMPESVWQKPHTAENIKIKMPASYGIGLSYRYSDALSLAFDLYRTDWSGYSLVGSSGKVTNPMNGKALELGRLKDTTQLRLGAEYLFIREKSAIPVRAGLFYDPEPQTNRLDPFYGFSLGTGYSSGSVSFDMAYQYRFGKSVTSDLDSVPGSTMDINSHSLMMSLIYYF